VTALTNRPENGALGQRLTLRAVTAIMAAVVGLTFLFGFGNVWALALRLGVYPWVAPLVAPAVDLSVLGLLLATRYLALHGASRDQLRPARRLLVFSSGITLALNVAEPLIAGDYGKAAFDAVGPLLLMGWAEVGPGLLQAISGITEEGRESTATAEQDGTNVSEGKERTTEPVRVAGPPPCRTHSVTRARTEPWPMTIFWSELGRKTPGTVRSTSGQSQPRRCVNGSTWERPGPECW
jgi:hypothetical protein